MEGLFKCVALGKSKEKSKKTGKYHYLFVQGSQNDDGLFETFTAIDFWTEEDKDLVPGQLYSLVLDINGDFVNFVEFVS